MFVICRKIQIVGLVARNLDYVLMANSKVAFEACTIHFEQAFSTALPILCPAWTDPVRIRAVVSFLMLM